MRWPVTLSLVCLCLPPLAIGAAPAGAANSATANAAKVIPAAKAMQRTLVEPKLAGTVLKVLQQFRSLSGVRLEVNVRALAGAGVKESDRVSLKAPKATSAQLLDMLLARLAKHGKPLGWYVDGDTVHVTTQAEVFARKSLSSSRSMALPRRRPPTGLGTRLAMRPTTRRSSSPGPRKFSFDETPAEDVFNQLRHSGKINIFVNWSSLEQVGIDRQKPITLKASGISLRRVLDMVTDKLSGSLGKMQRVYWVLDGGVVTVATGEALNTRLRSKVFDVADLLAVVPNFEATDVSLSTSATGTNSNGSSSQSAFGNNNNSSDNNNGNQDQQDISSLRQTKQDTLIEIIKNSIGQDMWQPVGKGSIRLLGKKLVISQTLLGFKLLAETSRPR